MNGAVRLTLLSDATPSIPMTVVRGLEMWYNPGVDLWQWHTARGRNRECYVWLGHVHRSRDKRSWFRVYLDRIELRPEVKKKKDGPIEHLLRYLKMLGL